MTRARRPAGSVASTSDREASLVKLRELVGSDNQLIALRASEALAKLSPPSPPDRSESKPGDYDLLATIKAVAYEVARAVENSDLDPAKVAAALAPLLEVIDVRSPAWRRGGETPGAVGR